MERLDGNEERRKSPRSLMDLPWSIGSSTHPLHMGELSRMGVRRGFLFTLSRICPVGTKLDIVVLFPKGYELSNFELIAEVIRKDLHGKKIGRVTNMV